MNNTELKLAIEALDAIYAELPTITVIPNEFVRAGRPTVARAAADGAIPNEFVPPRGPGRLPVATATAARVRHETG